MVHAGAIAASGAAKLLSCGLTGRNTGRIGKDYGGFDNDYHRRNFVSMGAAAGVAAAFHAPIGGILFSLEEVSSFWDPQLTLNSFVCASLAAFIVNSWGVVERSLSGVSSAHELIIWRTESAAVKAYEYRIWEVSHCFFYTRVHLIFLNLTPASTPTPTPAARQLFIFTFIGVACGLIGASFNFLNMKLTQFRKKHLGRYPRARVVEALVSMWIVISCFYWVPVALPQCSEPLNTTNPSFHVKTTPLCPSSGTMASGSSSSASGSGGDELGGISEMATLLGQGQETALVQLFSRDTHGYFAPTTLVVFALLYFVASIFIYGIAIPSGARAYPHALLRTVQPPLSSHRSHNIKPAFSTAQVSSFPR